MEPPVRPLRIVPIVAFAHDRVIGMGNALPWRIPEDLRRFRRLTLGHPVIMGRKTFDSIGKPLAERTNIVVTRNPQALADRGVLPARSPEDALAMAGSFGGTAFVIGGAEIYAAMLPHAREIEATLVYHHFPGDAFFPALDPRWHLVACEHGATPQPLYFSFVRFARDVPCSGCALCAPTVPTAGDARAPWSMELAQIARSIVASDAAAV